MSKDSLINSHRPTKFSQVVGQDKIITSFKRALDDRTSHAFLFTGPPGVGKTTIARIGAYYAGATKASLTEIDGASNNSVDEMRALTETLKYHSLDKIKAIIVDECHQITKAAWQASLKMVEEPPPWVLWFFCTTELSKVPDTIQKSRCTTYQLSPLPPSQLEEYLDGIVEAEGFDVAKGVIQLCARQANGSVRRALSNLSACYAAKDRTEAARLLIAFEEEEAEGDPFKLAQALAKGTKWSSLQPVLKALDEQVKAGETRTETIRHVVRQYMTTIALGLKDDKSICAAFKILDAFSEPFPQEDGFSPVLIAVGRSIY